MENPMNDKHCQNSLLQEIKKEKHPLDDIWLNDNQNCLRKRLISVDGNHSEMLTTQLALGDDFNLLKLPVKKM